MKKNKYILITLFVLLFASKAIALNIVGIVVDENTQSKLQYTTVKFLDNGNGTYTDASGKFLLNDKSPDSANRKLVVSLVGYQQVIVDLNSVNNKFEIINGLNYLIIPLKETILNYDEVIVSANKKIQAVQEVPISFSILKGSDLNLRSNKSIEKILEIVPGVEIVRDNVSIRGTAGFTFGLGSRTALLLDGFPLLAGDNGDIKFEALPLYNVERVEIIKGAGSALYGTGALGGVVNIITEEPKENRYSVRMFSGFFPQPTRDEWKYSDNVNFNSGLDLSIVQKYGDLGLIGTFGYYDKQSYRTGDKEKHISGFLKSSLAINETDKINLLANVSLVERDDWVYWKSLSEAFLSQNDTLPKINSNKFTLFADYQTILDDKNVLLLRAGTFYTTYNNNLIPNSESYRQSNANSMNFEAQLNTNLLDKLNLTSGLNASFNTVRSFTFKDHNQSIFAAYSQAEYKGINDLILTFGARLDREQTDNNQENIVLSPKLGASYSATDYLTFRGSLGRGFRAPTIAEKYTSVRFAGLTVLENTLLKPETSYSYELGGNYRLNLEEFTMNLDIAVFQNDLTNLIDPNITGSNVQFQNISIARIRGIEIGTRFLIANAVGLEASVTLMDPVDSTLTTKLKYRAEQIFVGKLFVPFSKDLNLVLNYRYKSKWQAIDLLLAQQVKDALIFNGPSVLDLIINYNLKNLTGSNIEMNLSCFNILNYYYTEMVGNMGPTRMYNLQMRYTY